MPQKGLFSIKIYVPNQTIILKFFKNFTSLDRDHFYIKISKIAISFSLFRWLFCCLFSFLKLQRKTTQTKKQPYSQVSYCGQKFFYTYNLPISVPKVSISFPPSFCDAREENLSSNKSSFVQPKLSVVLFESTATGSSAGLFTFS